MSNGWKLELLPDGEGGAWLNYWDFLTGALDHTWHIKPDGTIFNEGYEFGIQVTSGPADLGPELLRLLKALGVQQEEYYGPDRPSL